MTGAELAAIRKAARLSEAALAKLACIGRSAVRYWETRNQVDLRAWGMQRIARVLLIPDNIGIARERARRGDRLDAQTMAQKAALDAAMAALDA